MEIWSIEPGQIDFLFLLVGVFWSFLYLLPNLKPGNAVQVAKRVA